MLHSFFSWLQKDNPTGLVEKYPELTSNHETSLKNVYVAGDLTGLPLLKLAADGGAKLVTQLSATLQKVDQEDLYDILIIGAGPAGISAAIKCQELNLKYKVLEAGRIFNTIENFPKGKPILVKPNDYKSDSSLILNDGTKESLLNDLKHQIDSYDLNISEGQFVQDLKTKDGSILVKCKDQSYSAQKVILTIGKSGNARSLGVKGENLPKVYNRLFDPLEYSGKNVLVVGGGDSALETSIALAENDAKVTHIYRQKSIARAKEENIQHFLDLKNAGKIDLHLNSNLSEVKETSVEFVSDGKPERKDNDIVFSMIGRELPLAFFKRSGIKIEGEWTASTYTFMVAMISFFSMLYFGKSGWSFPAKDHGILGFIGAPFYAPLNWGLTGYSWYASINFILGWLGALTFLIAGPLAFYHVLKKKDHYFSTSWLKIKTTYLTLVALIFSFIYFKSIYLVHSSNSWVEGPTYWYSLFYCTTMALFGWRRAQVKKTSYVKKQMITLVSIQVFFLFLLPFHLYDPIINLFPKDHWIISELFPWGKWTCFSYILFWPLSCWQFGTSTFWTIFPFFQTGFFLYWIVKNYGKGAYCGWICSCGGMAETLGDEYRNKAPHGPKAKYLENIGQFVLAFAFVVTLLSFLSHHQVLPEGKWLDTLKGAYKFSIDVFFAGVLGLGVYFFMGGRVWCRFGCPLAALMHIYTRFSKYRILSEKKKCISCNICTKVCHMGIDVMSFANKGIPMNDVECVRCSTCVTSCPMEVLSFDKLTKPDVDNVTRKSMPDSGKADWKAGIK